ncbi:MAG: peptidase C39 family protein [Pseudorhodoplanes sp.]
MTTADVMARQAARKATDMRLRTATMADLDALVALENRVFATDRCSRRSFRNFLRARSAALIVAEDEKLVGYALVLFRPNSAVGRLYSIAVAADRAGQGIGARLLEAAEAAALARGCLSMRLEVHEGNRRAIKRYEQAGYRLFGCHPAYYADGGDARRYRKDIQPDLQGLRHPPPYFHQTTEFTCGSACIMMALAAVKPDWRPQPNAELIFWRDATTIFTSGGPGGCDPFGLAVTLRRQGVHPEILVNNPGPYFLDTVQSQEKQRVMRLAQAEFRQEAERLGIPVRVAPDGESVLMRALESGHVAIVLITGYHMIRRGGPHWVFAFGCEKRRVLLHDPTARRDEQGLSRATFAVPEAEFGRMTRVGRDHLRAAIVIPRGAS